MLRITDVVFFEVDALFRLGTVDSACLIHVSLAASDEQLPFGRHGPYHAYFFADRIVVGRGSLRRPLL